MDHWSTPPPEGISEAIAAHGTVDLIFGAGAPHALAALCNGGEQGPYALEDAQHVSR